VVKQQHLADIWTYYISLYLSCSYSNMHCTFKLSFICCSCCMHAVCRQCIKRRYNTIQ